MNPIVLLISSFGYFGVMIFFVLSGYLVGGKLYRAGDRGFSSKYLLDRATRIYTVAVPAMVFGFLLMVVQQQLYGHAFSLTLDNCSAGWESLTGSMLFLHKGFLANTCFNGPHWSLVYEVFYYVFFLAVALAWAGRGRVRIAGGLAAILLALYGLLEPKHLWAYSTLWLLGMAAAQERPFEGRALTFTGLVTGAFIIQSTLRFDDPRARYASLAALLVIGSLLLLQRWQPFEPPEKVARAVRLAAATSFSLYLFHAPVMNFLRAIVEGLGVQLARGDSAIFWYLLFIVAGGSVSIGAWWLFERHTMAIRAAFERRFRIGIYHQSIPRNEPAADGPSLPARRASQPVHVGTLDGCSQSHGP